MKHPNLLLSIVALSMIFFSIAVLPANAFERQMEYLDRGAIAIKTNSGVYLSWRITGEDGKDIAFNIYRNGIPVNTEPITDSGNYSDINGTSTDIYTIKSLKNGTEFDDHRPISVWENPFLRIPLNCPPGGTHPDGATYSYNRPALASTECSVADLDGDGEYEIIVKWEPSDWRDNSETGFTGNTYIDAYKLDGRHLWRIDLGKNIRSGPHYTQFMVYDFDGDGLAEMVCKTAPGTIDGVGSFVLMNNDDPAADYRNMSTSGNNRKGFVLKGPEYLTLFDGATGAEKHTIAYEPGRGTVSSWGDSYGNRVDRFLACVAYLDGVKPSVVMCRGYYTRAVLTAYDVVNGKLVRRWIHDSSVKGQGAYGEGNHNLSVADVDDDGFDEIVYGACVIDHDGSLLYRTGFGHGDAMHVGKIDLDRDGLQVFCVHEETSSPYGYELHDAKTGKVIFGTKTGTDVGRGMAADIDSRYPGLEVWPIKAENGTTPTFDCKGNIISTSRPRVTFRVYWTGDLRDELLENNLIYKWDESKGKDYQYRSFASDGAIGNLNTRPCISADIFGDWREEIALLNDNCELLIFTTTEKTEHRLYTLMHDPVYRLGIAWQNVAYNQPPHLGFYIGGGTGNVPWPDMKAPRADRNLILNKNKIDFDATTGSSTLQAIPLGGLSGEVKWSVSEDNVIRITHDPLNEYAVNVEALAVGSVIVTAEIGEFKRSIPVNVSEVKVRMFTWNPTDASKLWDNSGNYIPATMPGVGDTVSVRKEMEINATPFSATILLEETNLRLRADAVSSADIVMSEGTAVSFATSGTGFGLNAKIKLNGNVTMKMSGSSEGNYLELSGNMEGTGDVAAFNNTNAENVLSKVILSGDNSLFFGTWITADGRIATSSAAFEGTSEHAFGNGKIVITSGNKVYFSHDKATSASNELTLLSGSKAIMNKHVTVGKLKLGDTEYTSGTFSASTHPEFFEGTEILTVSGGSGIDQTNYDVIRFDGRNLISDEEIVELKVFDISGKLVISMEQPGKLVPIMIRPDVYIIHVELSDRRYIVRKVFVPE